MILKYFLDLDEILGWGIGRDRKSFYFEKLITTAFQI